MDWIKTRGRLSYDPVRKDLRKTYKQRTLVVELPRDELDLYYQWFLKKKYGSWFELQRPMWGKHVTVVRGDEKGHDSASWEKHEGETIELFYSPLLENKWKFWSLPVRGDELFWLREELGLVAAHNFHITVARQYDWQPEVHK